MLEFDYICVIITIGVLIYLVNRYFFSHTSREGFEKASKSPLFKSPGELATEEVDNYNKMSEQMKKKFDISKNRNNYESLILNLDEFINLAMLELVIKTKIEDGPSAVHKNLETIAKMQESKSALNSVMKYIDSQ